MEKESRTQRHIGEKNSNYRMFLVTEQKNKQVRTLKILSIHIHICVKCVSKIGVLASPVATVAWQQTLISLTVFHLRACKGRNIKGNKTHFLI